MTKFIFLQVLIFCLGSNLHAQNDSYKESVELNIGASKHGTGDFPGFIVNTEYRNYFRPKLFFAAGLAATWHDGSTPILHPGQNGAMNDHSVRDVTAGFQLAGKLGWDFLQTSKSSLGIMLGPLVRYQSTTVANELLILYPAGTGLNFPVVATYHSESQRTVALGGIAQLSFRYAVGKRLLLGATTGYQTDTNGDGILQLGLVAGIRL